MSLLSADVTRKLESLLGPIVPEIILEEQSPTLKRTERGGIILPRLTLPSRPDKTTAASEEVHHEPPPSPRDLTDRDRPVLPMVFSTPPSPPKASTYSQIKPPRLAPIPRTAATLPNPSTSPSTVRDLDRVFPSPPLRSIVPPPACLDTAPPLLPYVSAPIDDLDVWAKEKKDTRAPTAATAVRAGCIRRVLAPIYRQRTLSQLSPRTDLLDLLDRPRPPSLPGQPEQLTRDDESRENFYSQQTINRC